MIPAVVIAAVVGMVTWFCLRLGPWLDAVDRDAMTLDDTAPDLLTDVPVDSLSDDEIARRAEQMWLRS